MDKKLVNVKELEKIISIPAWTIRKMVRLGVLPAYRPGGRDYLLDPDEVIATIKKSKN